MNKFSIIVAVCKDNITGIKQTDTFQLPWPSIKSDLLYLKSKIKNSICVMGRNTYNSMKGIDGYVPYVVTSHNINDIFTFKTFKDALHSAQDQNCQIFVLGGEMIYREAIEHSDLDKIYLTNIDYESKFYLDVMRYRFPDYKNNFQLMDSVFNYDELNDISFTFETYRKRLIVKKTMYGACDETQYYDLVKKIYESENKSIFGAQLRYNLENGFPLSTLKKTFWKGIVEEALWMLRGQTDVSILQEKNIHIWDKNSSGEYLKKNNLPYKEGDIGPGYGFQMRYCGAKYIDCKTDYRGQGIDQVQKCLFDLKNNPTSRRIMINLWNVGDIDKMALPCCHCVYQFSVKNGKLHCHLFQRSWDVLLGWNSSTGALITHIFAKMCDLQVGELIHSVSDAHIYKEHLSQVNELLSRTCRDPPQLLVKRKLDKVEDYTFSDFLLKDYFPYPNIKLEMIV